jgi:hypothetical protein
MAGENHIRNPLEWGWDQVKLANHAVGEAGRSLRRSEVAELVLDFSASPCLTDFQNRVD